MSSDERCPRCGEPLEFDEVDISVGVHRGNYYCPECGWAPKDPLREWEERAQAEADAQCAAFDAHPDKDDDD